eukprot:6718994-Prymnesium_polylepis.1
MERHDVPTGEQGPAPHTRTHIHTTHPLIHTHISLWRMCGVPRRGCRATTRAVRFVVTQRAVK